VITVELATSPKSKPCITMTTDQGNRYVLLTAKRGPMAGALIKQLKTDFACESLPGIPLDRKASLEQGELIFHDESGVIGVYVQESRFDELVVML
jgi:hypothetical protein